MKYAIDVESLDDALSEDELIEAIQGRRPELPRLNALKHFVTLDSPQKRKVFQSVLEDTSQPSKVMYTAAFELGKEHTRENREILVKSLKIKDDRVLRGASRALGLIGDEKALEQLEALNVPPKSIASQDVLFAKHLIAYRLKLNKHRFALPRASDILTVDKRHAAKFTSKTAAPAHVKDIYKQVKHQLPAIPLSEQGALQITCRSTEFLLAFNRDFQSKPQFEMMRSKNALPMVFLKKGFCPEHYFLVNYFFTHPSDEPGKLILTAVRPGGIIAYSGTVIISGDEYRFSFNSVKSRYTAALDVEGTYNIKTQKYAFIKSLGQTAIDRETSPAGIPKEATD